MSVRKGTQKSTKRTTATNKKSSGFTDEERAAMKERARELKAEARGGGRATKADGESDVLAKIAEMKESDRAMAKRLHAIIKASAPVLSPRTWYGMPAYARDGKVVCFFQSGQKFKTRYATLGFSDQATSRGRHVADLLRARGVDCHRRGKDQRAREEGGERRLISPPTRPGRQNGGTTMSPSASHREDSAPEQISKRIKDLGDWRGKTLARVRKLIKEADPEILEEWKWAKASSPGTPVWSHNGIVCTGETYKSVVKLTFAKGASLKDPARLFNSSLEGKVRRAIDIREGEELNEPALKELIRAAVALNVKGKSPA